MSRDQELGDATARLRQRIETLESEKRGLEEERASLHDEVTTLREELELHEQQQFLLQHQLTSSEGDSLRFAERYVEIEEQTTRLANLCAISRRLHGTMDRQRIVAAIEEIIINIVGSEELAILEMSPDGDALERISAYGLEPGRLEHVAVGTGLIGRVASSGEAFFAGRTDDGHRLPEEAHLTACVPLKIEDRVTGAIALFRLLPQKAGALAPFDYELLEMLAIQAATTLYCSALHARLTALAAGPRES